MGASSTSKKLNRSRKFFSSARHLATTVVHRKVSKRSGTKFSVIDNFGIVEGNSFKERVEVIDWSMFINFVVQCWFLSDEKRIEVLWDSLTHLFLICIEREEFSEHYIEQCMKTIRGIRIVSGARTCIHKTSERSACSWYSVFPTSVSSGRAVDSPILLWENLTPTQHIALI